MIYCQYVVVVVVLLLSAVDAFGPAGLLPLSRAVRPCRDVSMMLDSLAAQLSIATQLNARGVSNLSNVPTLMVAKSEVRQGLYKEYTVDVVDDSALDEFKRGYKTADETEESKSKYWTILAVLVFGSFAIPMAQYYWYVAEED